MPAFNFVGQSYAAADPLQDAQESINWYPEIDQQEDAKSVLALLGAPGCVSAVTSAYTGEVRGAWPLPGNDQCLWVIGNNVLLMTITAAATASTEATFSLQLVGTLLTRTGQVSIRDNATGGIAVIVDGSYGYVYSVSGKTVTRITDSAFLGADVVAFIDGWFIFNQPGTQKFYTAPLYWNGTNPIDGTYYSLKDSSSDNLVTLIENQRELWLIGERTTEVWYDAGNQYFPFSRLQGATVQVGCAAKHSVCRTGTGQMFQAVQSVIWLSQSERGTCSVVMTAGYQVQTISTPAVSYAISQYPVVDDAFAYVYTEEGHEFYVLTFPTANVTWVYDIGTQMWHKRARYNTSTGQFERHRGNCFANFANQRLIGDYSNGQIYRMSRKVYTDGPDPLVSLRRSPHVWDRGERNRVMQSRIQIEFTPGIDTPQGLDPQMMLRWSNDGGFTWSNTHYISMGKAGETTRRAIKRRLGAARDRVYEVRVSDAVNRDVVGATIRAEGTAA
jgi:hypothetical protein